MASSKAAKRAWRLREKVKEGKPLTEAERAELAAFRPQKRGPKGKAPQPELELDAPPGAPRDAPASAPEATVAPEFEAGGDAETPAPEAPRVKPRTEKKSTGTRSGNWRDAYRAGAAAGEREATCVQIAQLWGHLLKRANASIVANGGTPAIPDDVIDGALGKCLVLTVDKLMPADFAVGPEVEAAVASSVITSQAWWTARRARKAAEASSRGRAYASEGAPAPEAPTEGDASPERRLSIVRPPAPPKMSEDTVF